MSDDRAAEGIEHLQAAALEIIAAARAFLDVAEDLVADPERVTGTLAALAGLIDGAGRSSRARTGPRAGGAGAGSSDAAGGPRAADAGEPRLRRIDVS